MDELIAYYLLLRNQHQPSYQRYLYDKIDWNLRMIAIKGPRGAGKTTLLLQHIRNSGKSPSEALYVTADHNWFYSNTLFELATTFYQHGGRHLYIDEVHKYPNWSRELKLIYDGFQDMKVIFTSSSALDIFRGESDLSRRVIPYTLYGLSFREFLELTTSKDFPQIPVESLFESSSKSLEFIMNGIQPLPLFKKYLHYGYLPIFKEEGGKEYLVPRMQQVITTILENDLTFIENYSKSTAYKVKQLLGIIAQSIPFQPNISSLARKLDVSRESVYIWLDHLEKAMLINTLTKQGKSTSALQKPAKIFLENTNLAYTFSSMPNIGNIRETFLFNQLSNAEVALKLPSKGDFYLPEFDFTIEVGGKNKTSKQIKDVKNGFLAKDDIEFGFANTVPLWLFGFLY
ncbi:MAG TPA: ATP-binding protein [Leeuwenhoekiella sp.]|nr:ATP-binding protein [Leeuwenhoekiella sp.]